MSDTDVLEEEQLSTEETDPNFDLEAVAAALTADAEGRLRRNYDEKVRTLRRQVDDDEDNLRYYAQMIREINERLGRQRAELREAEANPPVVPNAGSIARDVARMRNFPGVLGLRVDTYGRIVAHIRTRVIYKNRLYHMGDFEVALGRPRSQNALDITCTRTGLIQTKGVTKCEEGCCTIPPGWTTPLYWHPSSRGDGGLGKGWFCFGVRENDVIALRNQGRYAELLHLVIATMCSINNGHERRLEGRFQSERCGPRKTSKLRRAGVAFISSGRDE